MEKGKILYPDFENDEPVDMEKLNNEVEQILEEICVFADMEEEASVLIKHWKQNKLSAKGVLFLCGMLKKMKEKMNNDKDDGIIKIVHEVRKYIKHWLFSFRYGEFLKEKKRRLLLKRDSIVSLKELRKALKDVLK